MTRFVVLLLMCFFAAARAAGAAEVRLHSTASCSATLVRLGHIAEIACDDPAIAHDLAAIALFPAPGSGKSRQLDRHQVRQLLAISGVDLSAVFLTGSEFVVVQSDGERPFARPVQRTSWHTSPIRLASHESADSPVVRPKPTIAEAADLPPLVKRGESVTINSRAAGVRVTTSGKAMADGALGSEIVIELDDKRTKVQGRVAGPQLIEIGAIQP